MTIPIHVLSGFLGSGKTTLLNRLLKDASLAHTAVIVNEVGSIGLDHLLFAEATDSVVLLEGGCLCCTVVDSLHETLAALYSRAVRGDIPQFRRVVVETTGLADPAPIVNVLLGHPLVTDHYRLEALVVTVDAQNAQATLSRHRELAKQVALADRLVWTKLDIAAPGAELESTLRGLNPTAEVFDGNSGDVVRAFVPGERHRLHAQPAAVRPALVPTPLHDPRVASRSYILLERPSWPGIAAWWQEARDRLGERLLRAKGLVEIAGTGTGEIVFLQTVQKVFHRPERLRDWPDEDHRSRLVCITHDVDRETLADVLLALGVPFIPVESAPQFNTSGAHA